MIASSADIERRPVRAGEVRTVTLVARDGVAIAGRHWVPDALSARGAAIVLAHGFSASAHQVDVVELAETLAARGFDVVSYDARGHGASEGTSTLGDAERFDVAAAAAAAARLAPKVVLLGASMGAIAVLRHAAQHDTHVTGVVVLSCPARWRLPRSAVGLAAVLLTRTRVGRRVAARHIGVRVAPRWTNAAPPVELLATVAVPVAVVHGADDRFIRPRDAHELHSSITGPRHLHVVPGLRHAFGPLAIEPLLRAIEWVLAESPDTTPNRTPDTTGARTPPAKADRAP